MKNEFTGLVQDVLGSAIALAIVWSMLSFFFEYQDPVMSVDSSEQLVATNVSE